MKTRKPRPTETGTLIGVRLQAPDLAALDAWRKEQPDLPTRPEGVRRLMDIGIQTRDLPKPPEESALPALLEAFRAYVIETATDGLAGVDGIDEYDLEGARRDAVKISQLPDDITRRALHSAMVFLTREAKRKKPRKEPKPEPERPAPTTPTIVLSRKMGLGKKNRKT